MLPPDLIPALRRFRNVALEGVPGTGKTSVVAKVVAAWHAATARDVGGDGTGRFALTMHPSTGYEDVIEGLRSEPVPAPAIPAAPALTAPVVSVRRTDGQIEPLGAAVPQAGYVGELYTAGGTAGGQRTEFVLRDGFFLRACSEAARDPDRDYLVLLDELNRANVPRVLGDLLLTLEADKRALWDPVARAWDLTRAHVVTLPYSGRLFFVPSNIYVLATMNTTDRSVAALDAALRRRFAFVRLEPLTADAVLDSVARAHGAHVRDAVRASIDTWDRLNRDVLRPCLGPDGLLGHSYLFALAAALADAERTAAAASDTWEQVRYEVLRGQSMDGRPVSRVVWVQTGAMTGASRNQLDLSHQGARDKTRGIAHLFMSAAEVGGRASHPITLEYEGRQYRENPVDFPGGNGTWRMLLNGSAADGSVLTPFALPHFREKVLSFSEVGPDDYVLRAHDLALLGQFQAASPDVDQTSGKRAYGTLSADALRAAQPDAGQIDATSAARLAWRYSILPQLIEALAVQGADELLDASMRIRWFEEHPDLADVAPAAREALAALDAFLRSLNLTTTVAGTGLGRGVLVSDVPPAPAAPSTEAVPTPAAAGPDTAHAPADPPGGEAEGDEGEDLVPNLAVGSEGESSEVNETDLDGEAATGGGAAE